MKKGIFVMIILLVLGSGLQAQRVSVRLNFPAGIRVGPSGAAPFRGAIWIGPEWRWQRGQYVAVPGYWARPVRHRAVWVAGHWQYTRRGYRWVPGHWR